MMKQTKNIPELRFPEFEGEWIEMQLGELTSKIGSGSTPKGGDEIYQSIGIPFIRSQNIIENHLVLDDTCIPLDIHYKMLGSKVCANDVLLNITGASIGRSCVVPEDFTEGNVNQHVSIIRLKKDNSKFLQLFISSSRGQKLIYEGQTGSGREGLNFESIKRFKIHFPPLPEQQKIASFLSAADQRIQLLTQKKEKLEQYKKGIMQQIFSQQLRFKDENVQEYPEWEEKRLGDFFDITSSKRVFQDQWTSEGVPFYRAREIVKLSIDGFVNNELFISEAMFHEYSMKYGIPKYNDILITGVGTLGKVYIVRKDEKFYFKDGNIIWLKTRNNADSLYIKHLFDTKSITRQIHENASITTVGTYTIDSAKKTRIPAPSLPEQQKIASFLSSIDQKITLVNQQIELTRKWKQGLLQKMFV